MRAVNPACKFISLLAVTLVLAWWHDPVLNLVVFGVSVVLLLLSGVRARTLFLLMAPIFLFALGMFFTGYRFAAGGDMPVNEKNMLVASSAFWNGMTLASRVLVYAGVGYLFALTTDRIVMVRSFQKQFHLPQIFAYGLRSSLGILPHMIQEYKRTKAAFHARGLRPFAVSPALLGPLLVKSVRWSEELAIAMESKGFSGKEKRTEFAPVRVRAHDWVFLAVCLVVFPAVTAVIL